MSKSRNSSKESRSSSSSKDNRSSSFSKDNRSSSSSRNNSSSSLSRNHSNSVSRYPDYVTTNITKTAINTTNRMSNVNNTHYAKNVLKNSFSANSSKHTNNPLTNVRFIATPHFVSDKQNRTDYSLSSFSKKMIDAVDIVSKNRKRLNKIEKSPFSGKYTTTGEISLELKQAKLAIDSIPNNNLSKTLAQNTLVTTIEESGKALLKHNNELGHILVASAKKFNVASQMSDLFEFVNYASKNNTEKANEKLADISGGLAGAYAGAKIGARGGVLGTATLSVIFGAIGSDKEKREWIINKLTHKNEYFNFRKGEFDNLEKYAAQSEKIKQEMSSFKTTKESVIDTNNNHLFDLYHPNIIQDGTK